MTASIRIAVFALVISLARWTAFQNSPTDAGAVWVLLAFVVCAAIFMEEESPKFK